MGHLHPPKIDQAAVSPARRTFYRPELDALRLLAFCLVFCNHAPLAGPLSWLQSTGMFGMDLFFLLSAYLLITLLIREREVSGTVDLKAFFLRRVLRIWPLYFCMICVIGLLGRFFPVFAISWKAGLALILLLGNVWVLRNGWTLNALNPLWSLSVEEQFYLCIPALVFLGGSRAMLRACIAAVVLAYGVLTWLALHHATPMRGIWANSFVQFQFFAAGGFLALGYHYRPWKIAANWRAILFVGGVSLWIIAARTCHLSSFSAVRPWMVMTGYPLALIGTVSLFAATLGCEIDFPEPILYLGKISYGLYMFHDVWLYAFSSGLAARLAIPFFSVHQRSGAVLALLLTVASAAISYKYFEAPILRYKQHFERISTRPV